MIIATGAIEYPAEYQAMAPEALSQLGISKAISISSTYDHRIIQGAESGAFLARVHEFIIGKHEFYNDIFLNLGIPHAPFALERRSQSVLPARRSGSRADAQRSARHRADQCVSRARSFDRRHRSAARAAAALSPGARHRDLRPDDLGPRSRVHHRRTRQPREHRRCARFSTCCNALTAAKSASSIATFKAKKRSVDSRTDPARVCPAANRFRSK